MRAVRATVSATSAKDTAESDLQAILIPVLLVGEHAGELPLEAAVRSKGLASAWTWSILGSQTCRAELPGDSPEMQRSRPSVLGH